MKPVSSMTEQEKIKEAIELSMPYMPAQARHDIRQLLTPEALSVMAVVTGAWAVSHFFGVGEIADVVLLVAGSALLGKSAVDVGRELLAFARTARNARTAKDLDEAARHFAKAIVLGGFTIVSGALLVFRPGAFREPINGGKINTLPPTRGPAWGRHKPKVIVTTLPNTASGKMRRGTTDLEGNIYINASLSLAEQLKTLRHEQLHSLLTAKLYFLRNIRIRLSQQAYNYSYLLRYLEEAWAQLRLELAMLGVRGILPAISFPVKNGYVTVTAMRGEAAGVVLGGVNVGAQSYRVIAEPFDTTKSPELAAK